MESFGKQIQCAEHSAPCTAVPLPICRNTISYHQIPAPATSISQHCRIDSAPSHAGDRNTSRHSESRWVHSPQSEGSVVMDTHQAAACRGRSAQLARLPPPVKMSTQPFAPHCRYTCLMLDIIFDPEDRVNTDFRNVGKLLPQYAASHLGIQHSKPWLIRSIWGARGHPD
jgi:hypothetical protein